MILTHVTLKSVCLKMHFIFISYCLGYQGFNSTFYFILLGHGLLKVHVYVCMHACWWKNVCQQLQNPQVLPAIVSGRFFQSTFLHMFPLSSLSHIKSTSLITLKSICLIPGYNDESKISSLTEVYQHTLFSTPQVLIQS